MASRFFAFLESPLGRILRGLVSTLLILWLVGMIDWQGLAAIRHASLSWTLATSGLLLALLAYPVCAWRWQTLLHTQGVRMPFPAAHRIVWIGQFYNAFLPGGIGGDAARLTHACLLAPGQMNGIATATALDRVIGFAVLLALALPASALWNASAADRIVTLNAGFWALGGIGAVCLLVLFFLPEIPAWLPARIQTWNVQWSAIRENRPQLGLAALASMAVWILDFASGWLLALSVGLPLTFTTVSLALIMAYLSTLLPISLGGHGLRESTLLFTVALLTGIPTDDSRLAAFSLLFLATTLLSSLLGGAILATGSLAGQKARSAPANP